MEVANLSESALSYSDHGYLPPGRGDLSSGENHNQLLLVCLSGQQYCCCAFGFYHNFEILY